MHKTKELSQLCLKLHTKGQHLCMASSLAPIWNGIFEQNTHTYINKIKITTFFFWNYDWKQQMREWKVSQRTLFWIQIFNCCVSSKHSSMPRSQLKLTSCIVCNSNYSSFFFLNYKYMCNYKYKSLKALNKNCSFKQYTTQNVTFVIIFFLLKCKHFTSEQL